MRPGFCASFLLNSVVSGIEFRYLPPPAPLLWGRMQHYSWFDTYRVALLETDISKVPERIALAREKLKQRMQMAALDAAEQEAIVDALNTLHAVELHEKSRSLSVGET